MAARRWATSRRRYVCHSGRHSIMRSLSPKLLRELAIVLHHDKPLQRSLREVVNAINVFARDFMPKYRDLVRHRLPEIVAPSGTGFPGLRKDAIASSPLPGAELSSPTSVP
jgi:hypothetical protein